MDEESENNLYKETGRKNESINSENEMNEIQRENLNLIQEGINQEINIEEEKFNYINNKEDNIYKEPKKYYENLSINNINFNIPTKYKNNNDIKIVNNYDLRIENNILNNNSNKYSKYNDELKRYYFNKEFSNLHINIEEKFLERMKFDIYRRQIKEKKIDDFVNKNKVKIKEENKLKTFNHLIEDAQRRLKAQSNAENLKLQLSKDLISKDELKKYNKNEWMNIYQQRFQYFLDKVKRKNIETKKYLDEEKKKKEDEILKYIPNKKASIEHIIEVSEKMYEEGKKRNIKNKEKIEKLNNLKINDICIKNKIKKDDKLLNMNNKNNNLLSNILNGKKKINNKNNINENIKNRHTTSKINMKKENGKKYKTEEKNNHSNKYINLNIDKEDIKDYTYDLDKERKILLQMMETKKLPKDINNKLNKLDDIYYSQKIIKTEYNNKNKESDKIIDEFFMRQLI